MSDTEKNYTAFWPVLIVFACFTITNLLNLYGNLETRSGLVTTVDKLVVLYNRAQAKEAALNGMAHDLIDLAPTSTVAQQIVTDFRIQLKNQPAPAGAAPAAPAPTPTAAPASPAAANNAPKP